MLFLVTGGSRALLKETFEALEREQERGYCASDSLLN